MNGMLRTHFVAGQLLSIPRSNAMSRRFRHECECTPANYMLRFLSKPGLQTCVQQRRHRGGGQSAESVREPCCSRASQHCCAHTHRPAAPSRHSCSAGFAARWPHHITHPPCVVVAALTKEAVRPSASHPAGSTSCAAHHRLLRAAPIHLRSIHLIQESLSLCSNTRARHPNQHFPHRPHSAGAGAQGETGARRCRGAGRGHC